MMIDRFEVLGGMLHAQKQWRSIWNAYRFYQSNQLERMRGALQEVYGDEVPEDEISVNEWLYDFLLQFIDPLSTKTMPALLAEGRKAYDQDKTEFTRLLSEFRQLRSERVDNYMDVINQFFRAYGEFSQALLYVRLKADVPENAYAPSIDFEGTRMYYGDAFEALGSGLDFAVAINNVLAGRAFDRLQQITLKQYRASDKGRRHDTLRANPVLELLVEEYDNGLRNASHHRWLKLSADRSGLSYRAGGNGPVRSLTYAEYLHRCCAISTQLMLLFALELAFLSD